MKYNSKTKEIFTDKGELIKQLNCPENIDWENMEKTKNDLKRKCLICNKMVLDTEYLSDEEVLFVINKDANSCLRINMIETIN